MNPNEELLKDILEEKHRKESQMEERLASLRIPLDVPTEEEMEVILSSLRTFAIREPNAFVTFYVDRMGGTFDIAQCDELQELDWLVPSFKWLRMYNKKLSSADTPVDRDFAFKFLKDQLTLYFTSICDAWNAKYTVVRLSVSSPGQIQFKSDIVKG